jgi:hypothetical protein
MKTMNTIMTGALLVLVPFITEAKSLAFSQPADTVVIELENGSKIIIYTKDRVQLKKLQAYDINAMVRDLNKSLGDSKVDRMEIQEADGRKYQIADPDKFLNQESKADSTVRPNTSTTQERVRIRIGGFELEVDPNEVDKEFDHKVETKKYTYVKEETNRTRDYFNIDIGINNWIQNGSLPNQSNELYAVKPWGSWYVGLNWTNRTWVGGPLFLEWGGGFSWYNFKLENPDVAIVKGADEIEFIDRSVDGVNGQKSKLTASYLNASFVPMLDFGRGSKVVKVNEGKSFAMRTYRKSGFRMGAGVYGGMRLGSMTKFSYKEDGDAEKDKNRDHYYLENFRYGVRAQIGVRDFDMFVTYDMNEVFAPGRGPKLNAFTVGITL